MISLKPSSVFFLPEKMKSARETIFWYFFGFFLGQKIFFSPTFSQIFSGILKFSWREFQNFSRVEYYFSRAEILDFFVFSRGKFCIFFSGTFFFSGRILLFFLGNNFFFSGSFHDFFFGSLNTSRAEYRKPFRGEFLFFFSGKKKNTGGGRHIENCLNETKYEPCRILQ